MSIKRYMNDLDDMVEHRNGDFVTYDGHAAEVARLNEQVQALAAEVTAVKDAIPKLKDVEYENDNMDDVSLAEDIGFNDAVTLTNSRIPETPATDAILNEVRAQGLYMYAEHLTRKAIESGENKNHAYAYLAANFAARIRAGEVQR